MRIPMKKQKASGPKLPAPKIKAAFSIFLFIQIFIFLTVPFSAGAAGNKSPLAAEAFGDPSKIIEMPDDWLKKSPVKEDKKIVIDLALEINELAKTTLEQFLKRENISYEIRIATCGTSAADLRKKEADLASYCCPPGEMDRLPGVKFTTLGITGVAYIVHPDNPANNISLDEARRIFQGEIANWSDVAAGSKIGKEIRIVPIIRPHCKTRPGHWRLLLKSHELYSISAEEVGLSPDMFLKVSSNPYAIGHLSVWLAMNAFSETGKVKSLSVDGYMPNDRQALARLDYPIYKTLVLASWEGKNLENPNTGKVIKFLLDEFEKLPPDSGVVPPSVLREGGWKFKEDELIGEP